MSKIKITPFIIILGLLFYFSCSKKQYIDNQHQKETTTTDKVHENVSMMVDVMAQFPGGNNNMIQWLSENMKYPKEGLKERIEGLVMIRFVVDSEGKVKNPEVIRSLNPIMDQEALRVISLMPDWIPAEYKGKKVAMYYNLPIRFKVPNRLPSQFVNP